MLNSFGIGYTSDRRGRKPRVTTPEMIADLRKLNKEEFCEKHKVGENFFLKLYYNNIGVPVEQEVQQFSFEGMFEDVIPDADRLIEIGYAKWLKEIEEKYKNTCFAISDICHKIEICDEVSQIEKIVLYDMIKEARIDRRKYKDGIEFAKSCQNMLVDFCTLVSRINGRKKSLKERAYCVRILREEFGVEIKK